MIYIFDIEGTLRTNPNGFTPNTSNWEVLPNVLNFFFTHQHLNFGFASNCGGVHFPEFKLSREFAEKSVHYLVKMLLPMGYPNEIVQICFDHPDHPTAMRKPNAGMLVKIMEFYGESNPKNVVFVGDRLEDDRAAQQIGCLFIHGNDFFELPISESEPVDHFMSYPRIENFFFGCGIEEVQKPS